MKNNKSIFWFSLIVVLIVFLLNFISWQVARASVVNISRIVFSTDRQVVGVGEVSAELNIQTQNSDGLAEALDETADLTLTTTSGTGEFSSSGTGWSADDVLTMNKTWSNRKFYYKDTTEGEFTITTVLTTRTTGKVWSTSQLIKVGEDDGTFTDGSGGSEDEDENSGSTTSTTTRTSSANSTHTSQDDLSDLADVKSNLKISIGRDRTVFVGVPVHFEAHDNFFTNPENTKVYYSWSFGDGASTRGAGATHIYMYPGEYNVVVNGEYKDSKSVTRIKLKVLAPDLLIGKTDDNSISLKNKATTEVNLSGYGLFSTEQKYIFPTDTIISASKSVIFPKEYIKLFYQGVEVWLGDYLGRKLFSVF